LKPERELGMGSATVTLRTTHPILRTVSVPVTWEASGDLYAIPEAVVLIGRDGADAAAEAAGGVAPAGPSRSVAVRSRSGRPFGLSQVEAGGPDIRVTSTPLSEGKGFLLGLSGLTASTNAAPRALRIRTDDGTVLTVPIRVVPRAP
jgi:hypothetical protein